MFDFLKKFKTKRPTLVLIHGFGTRRTDEFLTLIPFLQDLKYEVVAPNLFDPTIETDDNINDWMSRAEKAVDDVLAQKKKVILIGFSMGGVIATKIASERPIEKLILLAPAFTYLTLNNAVAAISKVIQQEKEKDKEPKEIGPYPEMPNHFTKTFMSIVDSYKDTIKHITIPTLFLHGIDDTVIPYTSSRRYIKKIPHDQTALLIFDQTGHKILDDPKYGPIAMKSIQQFIQHEDVL